MNLQYRNKKVAVSRWKKIHEKELSSFDNSSKSYLSRAILCGFIAGDGNICERKNSSNYELKFFPDDKLMLNIYVKILESIYHKKPSVFRKKGYYCVRITSKTILKDLTKYCNFGVYTWTLPCKLFKSNKHVKFWLKSFFSAEAYVSKKSIKLQSVNISSIKDVSNLLSSLGIEHKFYEYQPKFSSWSRVGIIFINKRSARLDFYKTIGFWHLSKSNKLKEALNL
jgi:DNA-binding transcriptional regulator WhiA